MSVKIDEQEKKRGDSFISFDFIKTDSLNFSDDVVDSLIDDNEISWLNVLENALPFISVMNAIVLYSGVNLAFKQYEEKKNKNKDLKSIAFEETVTSKNKMLLGNFKKALKQKEGGVKEHVVMTSGMSLHPSQSPYDDAKKIHSQIYSNVLNIDVSQTVKVGAGSTLIPLPIIDSKHPNRFFFIANDGLTFNPYSFSRLQTEDVFFGMQLAYQYAPTKLMFQEYFDDIAFTSLKFKDKKKIDYRFLNQEMQYQIDGARLNEIIVRHGMRGMINSQNIASSKVLFDEQSTKMFRIYCKLLASSYSVQGVTVEELKELFQLDESVRYINSSFEDEEVINSIIDKIFLLYTIVNLSDVRQTETKYGDMSKVHLFITTLLSVVGNGIGDEIVHDYYNESKSQRDARCERFSRLMNTKIPQQRLKNLKIGYESSFNAAVSDIIFSDEKLISSLDNKKVIEKLKLLLLLSDNASKYYDNSRTKFSLGKVRLDTGATDEARNTRNKYKLQLIGELLQELAKPQMKKMCKDALALESFLSRLDKIAKEIFILPMYDENQVVDSQHFSIINSAEITRDVIKKIVSRTPISDSFLLQHFANDKVTWYDWFLKVILGQNIEKVIKEYDCNVIYIDVKVSKDSLNPRHDAYKKLALIFNDSSTFMSSVPVSYMSHDPFLTASQDDVVKGIREIIALVNKGYVALSLFKGMSNRIEDHAGDRKTSLQQLKIGEARKDKLNSFLDMLAKRRNELSKVGYGTPLNVSDIYWFDGRFIPIKKDNTTIIFHDTLDEDDKGFISYHFPTLTPEKLQTISFDDNSPNSISGLPIYCLSRVVDNGNVEKHKVYVDTSNHTFISAVFNQCNNENNFNIECPSIKPLISLMMSRKTSTWMEKGEEAYNDLVKDQYLFNTSVNSAIYPENLHYREYYENLLDPEQSLLDSNIVDRNIVIDIFTQSDSLYDELFYDLLASKVYAFALVASSKNAGSILEEDEIAKIFDDAFSDIILSFVCLRLFYEKKNNINLLRKLDDLQNDFTEMFVQSETFSLTGVNEDTPANITAKYTKRRIPELIDGLIPFLFEGSNNVKDRKAFLEKDEICRNLFDEWYLKKIKTMYEESLKAVVHLTHADKIKQKKTVKWQKGDNNLTKETQYTKFAPILSSEALLKREFDSFGNVVQQKKNFIAVSDSIKEANIYTSTAEWSEYDAKRTKELMDKMRMHYFDRKNNIRSAFLRLATNFSSEVAVYKAKNPKWKENYKIMHPSTAIPDSSVIDGVNKSVGELLKHFDIKVVTVSNDSPPGDYLSAVKKQYYSDGIDMFISPSCIYTAGVTDVLADAELAAMNLNIIRNEMIIENLSLTGVGEDKVALLQKEIAEKEQTINEQIEDGYLPFRQSSDFDLNALRLTNEDKMSTNEKRDAFIRETTDFMVYFVLYQKDKSVQNAMRLDKASSWKTNTTLDLLKEMSKNSIEIDNKLAIQSFLKDRFTVSQGYRIMTVKKNDT